MARFPSRGAPALPPAWEGNQPHRRRRARERQARAAILKGEAGIGGPKRKDLDFTKAADEFMAWAEANKRTRTVGTYRQCAERLKLAFAEKRLGQVSPFDVERYKSVRIEAGVTVMVNQELACLRALYDRSVERGTYTRVKPLRESQGRLCQRQPKSPQVW